MNRLFSHLSDAIKGWLFIVIGLLLLLHTLGVIQRGISLIIIIFSLMIIVYGAAIVFNKTATLNYFHKIRSCITKK